ncbi:MAG: DUF4350 domain-containing protein [Lentisphaerae bacterium]|nr:DUF4350 domain-containing protein [Lentisphaerota bacterium]
MHRGTHIALTLVGILCVAGALAALIVLFQLRFTAGDMYPPYSSLRSDPLGTRVLYEALGNCDAVTTSRAFEPGQQLDLGPDTTLLVLGIALREDTPLDRAEIGALQGFMRRGGRLAITLFPSRHLRDNVLLDDDEDEAEQATDEAAAEEDPAMDPGADEETQKDTPSCGPECADNSRTDWLPAREWLDLDFAYCDLPASDTATCSPFGTEQGLPPSLACHTTLVLTNLTAEWQIVYERADHPLVVERTIGAGSLVISALSFFTSNEAMRDDRVPTLLAWLVGPATHVIFDEHHNGIARHEGIVSLAWKYGMHWFAATLLLLGGLFVWHSAYSLVPRSQATPPDSARAVGHGTASGLVNLLRRNIPRSTLERVCFEEWLKTHGQRIGPEQRGHVQALLAAMEARPAKQRNLPALHTEIRNTLKELT